MTSSCVRRCLLVAIIITLLPVPSMQVHIPTLDDFLSYWSLAAAKNKPAQASASQTAKKRVKRQNIGDSATDPWEVESSQLPIKPGTKNVINERYMPILGSGVISTTVYSNNLYVNGLYNGKGASSHRAQVPAVIMGRVALNDPDLERQTVRRFKFNAYNATFTEIIDTPYAIIEHRTYIHQKYVRLLVTDIIARKKRGYYGLTFKIIYPEINSTNDFIFDPTRRYEGDWKVNGRTREGELPGMGSSVYIYYLTRLLSVSVRSQEFVHETMMMSVDAQDSSAKNDFDRARDILSRNGGAKTLFQEHVAAWQKTWSKGKITVEGSLQLAKTTIFAQYYLYTSLPPQFANQPPNYNAVYFGIARNSLGKGGANSDYRGHIFWDNEMYIMPAILLFHPESAKYLLLVRSTYRKQAEQYAKDTGSQGYRFPWEMATSGFDVTPDTCPTCKNNALYVTAAVGWSIRQYYSATRDRDYMNNPDYNGCIMTREIARFWVDQSVYNTSRGRYYIRNVTGPDDRHPNVDNNAFTNVMASLAIHWARYFACLCNLNERDEVPDEWIQKALYLHLPFDNVKRLHYQYEGFEHQTKNLTNKQADTIMLTYPINWNMSRDIMRNDLEYYELIMSEQTPAMTWSFFTVGWKWAKEEAKMRSHFLKSYTDYIQQPFKIWTEYNEDTGEDVQKESTVNFLPGMGGYLQSLIYGFAGIRIRPEFLEFHEPSPPPDCDSECMGAMTSQTLRDYGSTAETRVVRISYSMHFTSFNYLGADLDIDFLYDRIIITVNYIGDYPLILKRNQSNVGEEKLLEGKQVTIDRPELGFYILTTDGTACDHPRDHIYMPWGYSPWISAAHTLRTNRTVTLLPAILALLLVATRHLLR